MLRGFIRGSDAFNRGLAVLAGVALIANMLILVASVVLRTVAGPLDGAFELISMISILVFGFSLGEAQTHQAHVSIDIVVGRFRKGIRLMIGAAVAVVSALLFTQLATSLVVYGFNLRDQGAATDSFGIPFWPSALLLVIGVAGLVIALAADVAKAWLARTSDDPHLNIF